MARGNGEIGTGTIGTIAGMVRILGQKTNVKIDPISIT